MREKQPGVWEVRVLTGNDACGRPTQISRTVRGSKRDAQRLAAQLEVGPARTAIPRDVRSVVRNAAAGSRVAWTGTAANGRERFADL